MFSGETLAVFTSKPGTIQACPISSLLFSIFLEVFASTVRLEEECETIKAEWEDMILLLFLLLFIYVDNLHQ